MSVSFFYNRLRQILTDNGAVTDGKEDFFVNNVIDNISNSLLTLGLKNTNSAVRGSIRGRFTKLRAANLLKGISPTVAVYNPQSKREIAEALVRKYGLPVDSGWFADGALPSAPPCQVQLDFVITPWTQSDQNSFITVDVTVADVSVADIFKNQVLSTPAYPWVRRLGYTNTEPLTYGTDFTPTFDDEYLLLKGIAASTDFTDTADPGYSRANNLLYLIRTRLGINAVQSGGIDGEFSLDNAKFVYNGPTAGYQGSNVAYDSVLVFDTETNPVVTEAVRTYRGRCYIHYNNVI